MLGGRGFTILSLRGAAFGRPSQKADIHSGTGATQVFGTSMPRLTAGRSPIRAIQACKFGIAPSVSCRGSFKKVVAASVEASRTGVGPGPRIGRTAYQPDAVSSAKAR